MTITVAIALDENQAYTPREAAVIAALHHGAEPKAVTETHFVPAPAPVQAEEPAPVEKPKTPRKPRSSTRAAVLEDTPEPVTEEAPAPAETEADQAAEELKAVETPTLDDAVTAATALIGDGKAALVKAALAKAGVSRVKELEGDSLGIFLSELEAA
jgi:outer membrane biosynthesis protein TonB